MKTATGILRITKQAFLNLSDDSKAELIAPTLATLETLEVKHIALYDVDGNYIISLRQEDSDGADVAATNQSLN